MRTALALLPILAAIRLAAQAPLPGPVRFPGYVQPRLNAVGDSAAFMLRRARLGVQGGLTPWASFKVQVELRTGGTGAGTTTIAATDLYVALAGGDWSAAVGQLKTPFSREFNTSSSAMELPERALAVDALAPNRDIGFMVAWTPGSRLAVHAGVFDGEGANRASNPDKRFLYVGRVVVSPAAGVDLGGAVAAAPDSMGWEVEVGARRGRVTLRAEYLARRRETPANDARGWYVLGTYLLARPGRLQLVGRVEQFDPTSAPGDRMSGYSGGAQYFFRNDDLKVMGSYTAFTEEGASVDNNRFVLQLQVRF